MKDKLNVTTDSIYKAAFAGGLAFIVLSAFATIDEATWLKKSVSVLDAYGELGASFLLFWLPAVILAAGAVLYYMQKYTALMNVLTAVGVYGQVIPLICVYSIMSDAKLLPGLLMLLGIAGIAVGIYGANFDSASGKLICILGSMAGASIELAPGESVIIGRDSSMAGLVVPDNEVSRKHCAVRRDISGKKYYLTDFSTNGTVISGKERIPVGAEVPLPSGAVIQLSQSTYFKIK